MDIFSQVFLIAVKMLRYAHINSNTNDMFSLILEYSPLDYLSHQFSWNHNNTQIIRMRKYWAVSKNINDDIIFLHFLRNSFCWKLKIHTDRIRTFLICDYHLKIFSAISTKQLRWNNMSISISLPECSAYI